MKAAALSLILLAATACTTARNFVNEHINDVAEGETAGNFIQEENDLFALVKRDTAGEGDEFYTQGLRWGKTFNPKHNPRAVRWVEKKLQEEVFKQFAFGTVWTIGIAQTMFTPDRIDVDGPQPHDRPWAGYIYLDNTLRLVDDAPDPKTQIVLEVQTGTIGKRSGAEWAQSALHAVRNLAHPTWHDQLERGVAIEAIYLWNRRLWGTDHYDVLPFAGGAAGTTQIYANIGAHARLGWNLRGFMNTGPMGGTFAVGGNERPATDGFVYIGGQGALVPYNYFLSRGDFKRELRVHDWLWGASLRVGNFRLTGNFVRRSREHSHPRGPQYDGHPYGSLVFSYELALQ